MLYKTRDPKRDHNFESHPYVITTILKPIEDGLLKEYTMVLSKIIPKGSYVIPFWVVYYNSSAENRS